MATRNQPETPRIFISHAWEDKALVRRLEQALRTASAEVWVDHEDIRGGDNLPKRISDALEWCNTLLLIWSEKARNSRWVELEWTNAVSLQKAIIPCKLDGAPLPAILASKAYLSFQHFDDGLKQLLQALRLARQPKVADTGAVAADVARVLHSRMSAEPVPVIPKPPQMQLRSEPKDSFTRDEVVEMLQERGFFDKHDNPNGKGIAHRYEPQEHQNCKVVVDHATGLTWQQSGSRDSITYADADAYIRSLNQKHFAGNDDWRLPTLEEAMSLMEPKRKSSDLYIDSVFDKKQRWIWTADKSGTSVAWVVIFSYGYCGDPLVTTSRSVRAVR